MKSAGKHPLPGLFREVAGISPRTFFLEYFFSMAYGVTLALTPIATEKVFDGIVLYAGNRIFLASMLAPVFLLFGVSILGEIFAGLSDYYGEVYGDLTNQKLFRKVNEKIGRLDAIDFEKPELLNDIEKSYAGAASSRKLVHVVMDILTMYLPYFLVYGYYLYTCRPVLPLALVFIFLPVLLAQRVKEKRYAKLEDDSASLRRKKEHFADCMTAREYVKETRSLDAVSLFRRKYDQALEEWNCCLKKTGKAACKADGIAMLLNMTGYAAVILLLLDSVWKGYIALGAFVAVFTSVRTVYDQMEELVADRAGELAGAYAKVKNYLRFRDIPCETREPEQEFRLTEIRAEHIAFAYPDGTQALRDVSFTARQGQLFAIVGENGSGKSTLTRLLTGIYQPSDGVLLYNGQTAAQSGVRAVRRECSQLFQQYCRYQATLAENTAIGQELTMDFRRIRQVLAGVGLEPSHFSDGILTMLGREFGGIELSGGQWQRVALARGIYRDCRVLVLDEPTAAIDPMRESELYHTFQESCKGKIGFIVTHRLGIVKLCDQVLVMRQGRLLDAGPHEALLKRCGYYRQLWNAQAEQYQ